MRRKAWSIGWRLAVCLILLAWLSHTIFLNEGREAADQQGIKWDSLSRAEQWKFAWHYGPIDLWHNLSIVDPRAFSLSVLLMGCVLGLGIMRWRTVLRVHGLDLSWGRATEISLVAHFFNSFLLGSTGGDLMKAYFAARETHHKKTEAVLTVFVDRLIGLWAMLLFGCVMMIPNTALLFGNARLRPIAVLILAMAIGCTGIVILAFWGGVSRRWTGARIWLRQLPKGEWVERLLNSCREFGRERTFIFRALFLSTLLNLFCVCQVMALASGLGLRIPPVALLVIVPVVICISALPITPSGLGVRENLFVLMLAAPSIAVAGNSALSLSLLTLAGSLFWSLVGGAVYITLKQRHHLAERDLVKVEA